MAASNDIKEILSDLRAAGKSLREAAEHLKNKNGNKPVGDSLREAIRSIASSHSYASSAAKGIVPFLTEQPTDGDRSKSSHRQPQNLRDVLSDMVKQLTTGQSQPKPGRLARMASAGWNRVRTAFAGTRVGRFAGTLARTKAGRAVGGFAVRAAGSVGIRAGASGASAAAAGAGAMGLGASLATGVGIFVGVIALVGAALYGLGKAVTAAADSQLTAMRQYEKVSAGIAMVFAQADMRDVFRNMERGERLAPSAQRLSSADQKLKDNSSEIVILVERIQNNVLAFLEEKLAPVLELINEAAEAANEFFGSNKEKDKAEAFDQFLDRVARDSANSLKKGDEWHAAARADRR